MSSIKYGAFKVFNFCGNGEENLSNILLFQNIYEVITVYRIGIRNSFFPYVITIPFLNV